MNFKYKVDNSNLHPELVDRFDEIDMVHEELVGRKGLVTSGRDGKHKKGSLHYVGQAIDLRTRDLPTWKAVALTYGLKEVLGKDFDVVLEADHIHLEYDPKEK